MNEMTRDVPSVTLYPSRLSAVGLLLTAAALTAAGIWMGLSGRWIGFLMGGFFALGIPIAVLQLIPGSTYLHVDQTGFTFSSSFRKCTIPWSIVDEFFVVTLRQYGTRVHTMVGFNFVPSYDRARLGRQVTEVISQCEAALPCTYGKKAEELAEFMNSCLAKAEFKHQPENMLEYAKEIYEFCPDVVEQGAGTVEALADEMKRTNTLYLWWD